MRHSPRSPRLGGLDGLRAIAVIMVLIYHLFPPLLPGGYLGVDVFFTISGFLIATLLFREKDRHGKIALTSFWQRRARRLLPPLALVTIVSASLGFLVGGDVLYRLQEQVVGAFLFVSNWVFVASGTNYFTQDAPELLRNTWSLAIEEQFYVFLPLILILFMKLRANILTPAVFILLAGASGWHMWQMSLIGVDPTRIYFGSDSHVFGLLAGVALAAVLHRTSLSGDVEARQTQALRTSLTTLFTITGLGTIVWLGFTLPEGNPASFEGGFQLATLASLVVVGAVTRPGAPVGRVLDAAPLRYIGERSYGIYLWHWPLLILSSELWSAQSALPLPGWGIGIVTLIFTIVAADLSHRFFETPIRRLGLRSAYRAFWNSLGSGAPSHRARRVARGIAALLVVSIPLLSGAILAAPQMTSSEAAIERGRAAMTDTSQADEHEPDEPPTTEADPSETASPAALQPLPHGKDVIALGDSVMLASAPEISATLAGAEIDAEVSRGLGYAVSYFEELHNSDSLRPILVIGLGTNGPIKAEDLDYIDRLTKENRIILVNAYADRWWIPEVNTTLHEFAESRRGVVVADWNLRVDAHRDLLAGDLIHPHAEGGALYASLIAEAIDALAESDEVIGFRVPRR